MAEESHPHDSSRSDRVARRATWAVIVTILVGTLWLAGILLFWAFWASRFDWFQNLVIVVASFITAGGLIGAAWVSTGLGMYPRERGTPGRRWRNEEDMKEEDWEGPPWRFARRIAWRIAFSVVLLFGFIAFTIIWLFFFAGGFNIYQNFAVAIMALLAFGGIGAAVWATMRMRWRLCW